MAAFVFKVLTLTIRTISKPLAGRVQQLVLNHPRLRKPVINLAQYLHRLDVAVNRGAEGKSGKVFVAHISEEKAMELAGKVISEGFVWAVAIAMVALEYERQKGKDTARAAKEKAFADKCEHDTRVLHHEVDELRRQLDWLNQNTVRRDSQLDALLQQLQAEEQRKQLKRSNSFYGMFGLR